jgi:hypothetical protein
MDIETITLLKLAVSAALLFLSYRKGQKMVSQQQ